MVGGKCADVPDPPFRFFEGLVPRLGQLAHKQSAMHALTVLSKVKLWMCSVVDYFHACVCHCEGG